MHRIYREGAHSPTPAQAPGCQVGWDTTTGLTVIITSRKRGGPGEGGGYLASLAISPPRVLMFS